MKGKGAGGSSSERFPYFLAIASESGNSPVAIDAAGGIGNNLVYIVFHETAGLAAGGRRPVTFTDNLGFIVGTLCEEGGMFATDLAEDDDEYYDGEDDDDFAGLGVMSAIARKAMRRSRKAKRKAGGGGAGGRCSLSSRRPIMGACHATHAGRSAQARMRCRSVRPQLHLPRAGGDRNLTRWGILPSTSRTGSRNSRISCARNPGSGRCASIRRRTSSRLRSWASLTFIT